MALNRRRSKWLIFRLFLPLPYTVYPSELKLWWPELRLNLGLFNEGYLLLVGSNSGTFFGETIALRDDAVVDCLIKWVSAFYQSPALNRPCLRAWTQLTYFLSFSTSPVFPLHFAMSRIFYFVQRPKRHGEGVSIISEWPSYSIERIFVSLHWWCLHRHNSLSKKKTARRILFSPQMFSTKNDQNSKARAKSRHFSTYTKEGRWEETAFGVKQWRATCAIVPTTQ